MYTTLICNQMMTCFSTSTRRKIRLDFGLILHKNAPMRYIHFAEKLVTFVLIFELKLTYKLKASCH